MLLGVARVLVQRTEVPEQTHFAQNVELLNDMANDRQVEPVRVGMALRIGFPAPQKLIPDLFVPSDVQTGFPHMPSSRRKRVIFLSFEV